MNDYNDYDDFDDYSDYQNDDSDYNDCYSDDYNRYYNNSYNIGYNDGYNEAYDVDLNNQHYAYNTNANNKYTNTNVDYSTLLPTVSIQRKHYWIILVLIILTVLAGYAARWQWQRFEYHQHLMQNALRVQDLPAVHLNNSIYPVEIEQAISVKGTWVKDSTTYISPRLYKGRQGAIVMSLFQYYTPDGMRYISVNRGWAVHRDPNQIPLISDLNTQTPTLLSGRSVSHLSTTIDLQEQVMPTTLGLWNNYNINAHAQLLKVKPSDIDTMIFTLNDNNIPIKNNENKKIDTAILTTPLIQIPADTLIAYYQEKTTKNKGYMFQWIGLCCVGIIGLFTLMFNKGNSKW